MFTLSEPVWVISVVSKPAGMPTGEWKEKRKPIVERLKTLGVHEDQKHWKKEGPAQRRYKSLPDDIRKMTYVTQMSYGFF